jgi:flavin reductase (DIM6/NTAB) family NADH-FMN oxidoreductase RutF
MEIETKAFPKLLVRTAVVITTISERGISNAAPFSFNSPISFEPPLYGFSCNPAHDTWRNIQENGEFVVNLVGEDLAGLLHVLETDYPYEDSEIAHAGLTEEQAEEVKPPRIKEALAWIECKLEKSVELGDHIWITGRVLKVDVKDEFWKEAGLLDLEKARLLCHISGESFVVAMKEARYKRAK